MASKSTGKSPAPRAKTAKPPKPAAKAAKPATAKAAKAVIAKPASAKVSKPATARTAKPAAKEPSRALTRAVKRPATGKATRHERPARHEKPGTGRVNRGPSIERMAPVELINGKVPERRVAPPAAVTNGMHSPFGKNELAEWRQMLLEHRSEISQDISHLEQDAMEAEDGHTTPNHIAERGSDAEMQDMSLGLAGEEQVVLWQIDRALRKIDSGGPVPFGLCEHTKEPIPKTRLQLIPWTPVSIEGMNYVEENGLTLEDVLVDG